MNTISKRTAKHHIGGFIAFGVWLVLSFCGCWAEELIVTQWQKQTVQAEELYRKGTQEHSKDALEGAIRIYESMLANEECRPFFDRGKLEFNLGNTYYYSGALGQAILHYRRAEMASQNDVKVMENLATVRKKCLDWFPKQEKHKVLSVLLFWHYDLSLDTRFAILIVFNFLFWGVCFLIYFIPRWRTPEGGVCLVIIGGIALALAGSCFMSSRQNKVEGKPAVIVASETEARKGAGDNFEKSFDQPLHEGTECQTIKEKNGWSMIQLPDGRNCWIVSTSVEII